MGCWCAAPGCSPGQLENGAGPVSEIFYSVDVSDIFNFFCSGESEVPGGEGGDGFLLKIPRGGGGGSPGQVGGGGVEWPGGRLWEFGGGG